MTPRLAAMCLVTISLMVGNSPFVQASGDNPAAATLKGINTVYVIVEALPDSAKSLGLSAQSIQTDVELKLVIAGMHIVTREEGQKLPGRPFVYVRITMTKTAEAASVAVELDQDAKLERNNERAFGVTTWDTATVSAHPTAQVIRDVVKDDIDEFLKAWLSANAKN